LADTWADTTTPHGKLMITILGGLAEFERTLILARTNTGSPWFNALNLAM
jgi:DNA invertase Pin-like site-specific DNA recombinase